MSTAVATTHKTLVEKFAARYTIEPTKLLDILKATAFKQTGNDASPVTNEEMAALLVVADQYGLNPFTKEIFAFKDKHKGIVPVVSVDGWSRIINEHPQMNGLAFEPGEEVDAKEGGKKAFKELTCIIHRKDRAHPTRVTEYLEEVYQPPRSNFNGPWQTHPKRMHRHKALIQCARVAFGFGGIYDEDEAERIIEKEINPAEPAKVVAGPTRTDAAAPAAAATGAAPAAHEPAVIDGGTGEIINKNPPTPEGVKKEIEAAATVPGMKTILDRIMTLPPSKDRDEVMKLWNAKSLALRNPSGAPKTEEKKAEAKPAAPAAAAPPPVVGDGKPVGTASLRDDFKAKFDAATDQDKLDDAADLANGYEWSEALRGELNAHYVVRQNALKG